MLFRLHLKANLVPGWEEAYVRYTLIVDIIEKEHLTEDKQSEPSSSMARLRRAASSRGSLRREGSSTFSLDIPLLLEDGQDYTTLQRRAFVAAHLLRTELDRVDDYCRDSVLEIVEAVQMIEDEVRYSHRTPSRVRRSEAASSAFKILNSNRLEGLEQALRDLYRSCYVLMQVSSLNHVGFRKLIKKARKQLGKDICREFELPTPDTLKSRAFYLERSQEASVETKQFFQSVQKIEECYAKEFTNNDTERAKGILRALRRPPANKGEVLWMGVLLGMICVLVVWAAWLLLLPDSPDDCPFCTAYILATLPAFRALLVPMVWLWMWAFCCKIWEETAINYIFIMDCDQHTALGSSKSFRLAGSVCSCLLGGFVLYVGALRTEFYWGCLPTLYPLFLLIFAAINFLVPALGGSFSSTRRYFQSCLLRSALAPFFEVRFRENFVADVMTSMVVILRDMAGMVFFYAAGGATGLPEDGGKLSPGSIAHLVTGPLITALPYWWRLMQCLRRWHDTAHGNPMGRLHLVNAGKYFVSLCTITLAAVGCDHGCNHFYIEKDKWSIGRVAWFSFLCIGTLYSYLWDILMDWSLIQRVPESEGGWRWGPFGSVRLRQVRGYSSRNFYIFAMFSNLVGRLMWTFSIEPQISQSATLPQVFTSVVAVVEVIRRAQWALLRLENEHLSNASNYRSVGEVPLMMELAERQLGQEDARDRGDDQRRGCCGIKSLRMWTTFKGLGLMLIMASCAGLAVYVVYLASHIS